MINENTVTISKTEYDQLKWTSRWFDALEAAGLDGWEGLDIAHEIMYEWEDDE